MHKMLLGFMLICSSLFAKSSNWMVYEIYDSGTHDSIVSRCDGEQKFHISAIYNPNQLDLKLLYDQNSNDVLENGHMKIAIHPDIKNAVMVYREVDRDTSGALYDWCWFVYQPGSRLWQDLLNICRATEDVSYDWIVGNRGINPKWEIEDHPVSYDYPYHRKHKIVIESKPAGWAWRYDEKVNSDAFLYQLKQLTEDKDVKDIQISCDGVYYQERTFIKVSHTVEVP